MYVVINMNKHFEAAYFANMNRIRSQLPHRFLYTPLLGLLSSPTISECIPDTGMLFIKLSRVELKLFGAGSILLQE